MASDTFPWPLRPSAGGRDFVSEAARRIVFERTAVCAALGKGLTPVYNAVEDGAFVGLREGGHAKVWIVLPWPA